MIKYFVLGLWLALSAWSFAAGDPLWGWLHLSFGALYLAIFVAIETRG